MTEYDHYAEHAADAEEFNKLELANWHQTFSFFFAFAPDLRFFFHFLLMGSSASTASSALMILL